jgi:hypothetical protein
MSTEIVALQKELADTESAKKEVVTDAMSEITRVGGPASGPSNSLGSPSLNLKQRSCW